MAFHACVVTLKSAFNAGFASVAWSPTLHHPEPPSVSHSSVGLNSCACTFHPSISGRFSFRATPLPSKDASSAAVFTILGVQDLSKLDINALTPLTPELISRQATVIVGTIGHVAHGKSTLVKAISGVQTVRFKTDHERNITIKLGHATAKIYKCSDDDCPRPACYRAYGSAKENAPDCEVPGCGPKMNLPRHVSFVGCPGHDVLMATMLHLHPLTVSPSNYRSLLSPSEIASPARVSFYGFFILCVRVIWSRCSAAIFRALTSSPPPLPSNVSTSRPVPVASVFTSPASPGRYQLRNLPKI